MTDAVDAAVSDALEGAARQLEARAGNETYQKAWRRAAKLLRSMKPRQKLTDSVEQISSSST